MYIFVAFCRFALWFSKRFLSVLKGFLWFPHGFLMVLEALPAWSNDVDSPRPCPRATWKDLSRVTPAADVSVDEATVSFFFKNVRIGREEDTT